MSVAPTPYADVNRLLDALLTQLQTILATKLVGLYLYGSLAAGDFDYASSDIDFVAATATRLDEPELGLLAALHADIKARRGHWAEQHLPPE